MARPKRFELLTPRFVVWCSIQLSYGRVALCAGSGPLGNAGGTGRIGIGFAPTRQGMPIPFRKVPPFTPSPAHRAGC